MANQPTVQSALADTWYLNNRVNLWLLDALTDEQLAPAYKSLRYGMPPQKPVNGTPVWRTVRAGEGAGAGLLAREGLDVA